MQVGCVYELYDKDAHFLSQYLKKPLTDKNKTNRYFVNDCFKVYKNEIKHVMRQLRQGHIAYQLIVEEGYLPQQDEKTGTQASLSIFCPLLLVTYRSYFKTKQRNNMKQTYLLIALLTFSSLAVSQTCRDSITASTPASRFSINGQEVTDTETGLIWQKCPLGQAGSDCSTGTAQTLHWEGALQAAATQAQTTGKAWRLPNIKELRSIVEEKCFNPAINMTVFPNTTSSAFWSASPTANASGNAWYVYFDGGYSSYYGGKNYSRYVRLVRTGQ